MRRHVRSIYYSVADRIQRLRLAGKAGPEFEARAAGWGYRRQPPPHVMTTRNGVRMHFDKPDYIPLILDYLGCFEGHCLAVSDLLVGEAGGGNRLILDVGGNIGSHALQFAHALGPEGTVVTVEAMPFHAEAIRRNAALNGDALARIDVRCVAVGAEPGTLALALPAEGNGGCYSAGGAEDRADRHVVPMTTIDLIMEDHAGAELVMVKMDIEGSEVRALEGARQTIDRHRPGVMIEINESALQACGASSVALKAFFDAHGYRGFLIDRTSDGRPVLGPLPDGRRHENDEVLFVHASREKGFLVALAAQSVIDAGSLLRAPGH